MVHYPRARMHRLTPSGEKMTGKCLDRPRHLRGNTAVLAGLGTSLVVLLALVTVGGATAQNWRAGEALRLQNERVTRVAAELGIDPATIEAGRVVYSGTCTACHGVNGEAKPGLGKDLAHSPFVRGLTDTGLLQFLKLGRSTWDPMNTTGVEMPGKGGNPALDDDDLRAVVAYMRFMQAGAMPATGR